MHCESASQDPSNSCSMQLQAYAASVDALDVFRAALAVMAIAWALRSNVGTKTEGGELAAAAPATMDQRAYEEASEEDATCGKPGCLRCTASKDARPESGVAYQKPTVHHLKGLRAKPVWHLNEPARELPAWLRELEAGAATVLAEAAALPEEMWSNTALVRDRASWSAAFFINQGVPCSALMAAAPATWSLVSAGLDGVGLSVMDGCSFGNVFLSRIEGGGGGEAILPHCGATNARLRCQLPLCQPEGAGFVVAGVSHAPAAQRIFVFDDSFLHTVTFAEGAPVRITLIVDVWHPDSTQKHRAELRRAYQP